MIANDIATKCIFSALRALGVTYFFNIVAPVGGGHKIFDHQIGGGGHKNIAEVLSEIWPPYSKENGGPLTILAQD